jgi:hypothetical protein
MLHRSLRRPSSFGIHRGQEVDHASDGGPESINGSLGDLAEQRLELGEGVFDRIEAGRQVGEAGRPPPRSFWRVVIPSMTGQIVHHDDVAVVQFCTRYKSRRRCD